MTVTHGTKSSYVTGCRCDACSSAMREYQAEWRGRERSKELRRASSRKWVKANKKKAQAHGKVRRAIDRGVLVRANRCERCDAEQFTEASHTDYDKPLEVEWLCRPCHVRKDNE